MFVQRVATLGVVTQSILAQTAQAAAVQVQRTGLVAQAEIMLMGVAHHTVPHQACAPLLKVGARGPVFQHRLARGGAHPMQAQGGLPITEQTHRQARARQGGHARRVLGHRQSRSLKTAHVLTRAARPRHIRARHGGNGPGVGLLEAFGGTHRDPRQGGRQKGQLQLPPCGEG